MTPIPVNAMNTDEKLAQRIEQGILWIEEMHPDDDGVAGGMRKTRLHQKSAQRILAALRRPAPKVEGDDAEILTALRGWQELAKRDGQRAMASDLDEAGNLIERLSAVLAEAREKERT